jgi:hypothetical protein
MHPRNQPQRMRKPAGRVSEAVTSAASVVTIPASGAGFPRQTLEERQTRRPVDAERRKAEIELDVRTTNAAVRSWVAEMLASGFSPSRC